MAFTPLKMFSQYSILCSYSECNVWLYHKNKIGIGFGWSEAYVPRTTLHLHEFNSINTYLNITNQTTGFPVGNQTIGMFIGMTGNKATITNFQNDNLVLATGITEHLVITPAGNTGIGISTPQNVLHIHKPIGIINNINGDENKITLATNIYGIQITNNTTGTGQSSGLLIGLAANGNARMVQQGQQSISLGTNNVDVLIYGTTANGTKTFEQNNCGSITASKQGFQSSSACSCNNLISDKSCDLNLFPINLYIYTQNNVEFVDLGTTINFYSSYTDGQAYYWEIFDNNNNLIYSQNTFSWTFSYSFSSVDTFYITVTVDNMTSPKYRIIVSKLNCVCSGFSIGSTCHVIKTNQYVKFWNLGYVPDEIKNDSCIKNNYASHASCYAPTGRRWITAYGTPYEYKTDIYPWGGTYPPDPWYYTTSFSHGGKYSIKYEIAMRINSQQPKMKLSLTNKPCSLFEWRIPCDLNLKIKK